MGMGIFGALHIASQGLFTQQSAIGVTSHNLANVNTPGYSRQNAEISAMDPEVLGGIYFGRGSEVTTITKSYDKFLNNNIMLETSILGSWDVKETFMKQSEAVFNESSAEGLNAYLNDFFAAWEDLSNHPEGIPERSVLLTQGDAIASTLQNMVARLEDIRSDANAKIQNYITSINQLTDEIAQLNGQIQGTEIQSANANDLTDARQLKIEELATLIDIRVLEQPSGQVTILTSGGKGLVAENISWDLQVQVDSDRDNMYAIQHVQGGTGFDITDQITTGELHGLLEVRDEVIPSYIDRLNQMAASLVVEVNKLHYQGFGLDGSTANYFFDPGTVTVGRDSANGGGGKIYNARIEDPAALMASDFDVTFVTDSPNVARYEIYDTRNEQYVYHIDATNNCIVYNDTVGGAGADSTAQLSAGTYTGSELAAEFEAQLEAKSATGQDYDVVYTASDRTFTIRNNGINALSIDWTDARSNAASFLGFDDSAATNIAVNSSAASSTSGGYYAYAENLFEVQTGVNDTIRFDDGGGLTSAVLRAGIYTPEELAAEIDLQLTAAGAGSQYTVAYDRGRQHFTINYVSGPGNLNLQWADAATTAETLLGFNAVNSGAIVAGSSDTSDVASSNTRRNLQRVYNITSLNNQIVFDDGGRSGSVTATLTAGNYTGEELASEIERQLETTYGTSGQDYIVTYDTQRGHFTIVNASDSQHAITIDWTASSAAGTLGFAAAVTAVASGGSDRSDLESGAWVDYRKVYYYGMSARLANDGGEPANKDVFSMNLVEDAASRISMDARTLTDPAKVAAAQGVQQLSAFDIDGSNNTIVFDDDGNLNDGVQYQVLLANGRYTQDELAEEIERQLEANGSGQSYSVQYDAANNEFIIASNPSNANDLHVLWEHADTNAAFTLGFNDRIYEVTGSTNVVQFNEGGTIYTATLGVGNYSGAELAEELERQLEAAGTQQYTVSYDATNRQFTIANDGAVTTTFNWSSANTQMLAFNMGFLAVDDAVGAGASTTSDFNAHVIVPSGSTRSDFATGGGTVGDNRNALALADLKNNRIIKNGTLTFDDYYAVTTGNVGTDVAEVKSTIEHQTFVIEQLEVRRQSVSGVSLDEEMIDLIKYQQAYVASTKMISTLDQMLEELLGIR